MPVDTCAVSNSFWDSASVEFKKPFEESVEGDGERIAREMISFLEWQRQHDVERDRRDGLVI